MLTVAAAADLFIVLFDAIRKNGKDAVDHGARGYYFAEIGEYAWRDVAAAIGEALVALGLAKDAEPTSFSDDELAKYFGSVVGAPVACFLASRC